MKRRRRAAQLLSKMLNARRDKCDAGEEKGNKDGGGGKKTLHVEFLLFCDCQRLRGTVVRFFILENESDDLTPPSLSLFSRFTPRTSKSHNTAISALPSLLASPPLLASGSPDCSDKLGRGNEGPGAVPGEC